MKLLLMKICSSFWPFFELRILLFTHHQYIFWAKKIVYTRCFTLDSLGDRQRGKYIYTKIDTQVIIVLNILRWSFVHSFIHSLRSLSYGRSKASSKTSSPHRSSASSFNLNHFLFFLRPCNSCLRLLPRLPLSSILPSMFPTITCFRSRFLRKMWPIQLAFLPFIVCRAFLYSRTPYCSP